VFGVCRNGGVSGNIIKRRNVSQSGGKNNLIVAAAYNAVL